MRRLVFVGAEYEGFIYPNPSAPRTNPIILRDLTDHFVSFADSEISVERDGVTGTMTKIAYSLKFAKNDYTLFLKECYERFVTKGRSNYPRQSYDRLQVHWIGTQAEFVSLNANDYNLGDIAWVVDGRLMECVLDEDSGDNYWAQATPSMSYVNPLTIVYCVDITNSRGHENEFCSYINISSDRVPMSELRFWSWTETAPSPDRVYMHEHDYFSAPDDGNELLDGADFGGAVPLKDTMGDTELRNIEEVMSNSEYKRLNSEVKLMIGFATDESAERPNLNAYQNLSDFAYANKSEFIRLFSVNINWESYKETKDHIEFEAANPSLQSLLKSEGETQFDINIGDLDPQFIAIDKTIDIPLYGDHTFPVYDVDEDEGVKQSIMSTTDMEGGWRYYFPSVKFGDITGLDNGILQPLTFGDQTGEDVWSRVRNRPEKEYLLKNTKDYPVTVNIHIPYFKCHVNYRRERGETGHRARVLLLKGKHKANDTFNIQSSFLPLKYYAANLNGNPSDGVNAYSDMMDGDYWYDETNKMVKVWNENDNNWDTVVASGTSIDIRFFSNSRVNNQPPAKPDEPRVVADDDDYILYKWETSGLVKYDTNDTMSGMQDGSYSILHEWSPVAGTAGNTKYYHHEDLETNNTQTDVVLSNVVINPHEEVCFCVAMYKVDFEADESYSSHFYVYATSEGITEEDTVGTYPKMVTYLSSNHRAKKEDRYHGTLSGVDTAIVKGCEPIKAVEYIVNQWRSQYNGAYSVQFFESLNDVSVREINIDAPQFGLNWDSVGKRMYVRNDGGTETDVTPLEFSNVYYWSWDGFGNRQFWEYKNGDLSYLSNEKAQWVMRMVQHPHHNFVGEEIMYSGYHRIKDGFTQQNLNVVSLLIPVESLNGKSDPQLHINLKELLKWFKVSGYEYSIETDGGTGADTLVIAPREYFFDYRFYPVRPKENLWVSPNDEWLNTHYIGNWVDINESGTETGDYQGKLPIEENTTIDRDYAVTNGEGGDHYDKDTYQWACPELHERGAVTLKTNKSLCYSEIVIGYDKDDYDNLVGTNDPVSTFRYSTGYVTADDKKTLEMSTKIRMDFYGMMYWLIRSYSDDYDKSSDKTFCLDCKRMMPIDVEKTGDDSHTVQGQCTLQIWDYIKVDANIVQDDYNSHTTYYNALRTPYMLMKLMNRRMGLVFANELTFMKSENFTPSTGTGAHVEFESADSTFDGLLDYDKSVTAALDLRLMQGVADYCPPLFTLATASVKVGSTRMLWANLTPDSFVWDSGGADYVLNLLERPNELIRFIDDDDIVRYGFINKHEFNIYNYKEGEVELLLAYPRKKADSDTLTKELMIPPTNIEKL